MLGAQGAITRGMHPAICAGAGVTICFGGILRDLLVQRDGGPAVGSQSYAMAMGAGSACYMALRALALRGVKIPLEARITIAASTTLALRAAALLVDDQLGGLLAPMHDEARW